MRVSDRHPEQNFSTPTFEARTHCINCGSSHFNLVWQDHFSGQPTQSFLTECHYSADVSRLLHNQEFTLVRCKDCGMMFHQKILTPEWLHILYSQWIDDEQIKRFEADYHRNISPTLLRFKQAQTMTRHLLRLRKLLRQETSEQLTLLDYGCGDGLFVELANCFGFNAYGIDFSNTRSQRAVEKGVRVFGSLQEFDTSVETDKLDQLYVVTLFQVLEHLAEPAKVLAELAQRMHEGGILVVEVPNCKGIRHPETFGQFHAVHPLEHINAFTPATLADMCQRAGFTRISQPASYTTTEPKQIVRAVLDRALQRLSTNQYFCLRKQS